MMIFENGFSNYTDGGGDCSLYSSGTYAHQGNNAVDIQDNSGDSSSFYHTNGIDVDTLGYTSIKVDFWFYAVNMDSGYDFWVQYYDGGSWNTIADYDEGDEFVDGIYYHKLVWINETDYTFPSDMKIKFTCDAQNNNNDVYIDEIYVNASGGNSIDWTIWGDTSNPDTNIPWSWNFNFPNSTGYYEFYSIGKKSGFSEETTPSSADAICGYSPSVVEIDSITNQRFDDDEDSWSHTCSGDNRLLVVSVALMDSDSSKEVDSISYNGASLTRLTSKNNDVRVEVWYLINPSSGSNTISLDLEDVNKVAVGVISYYNVDQSTPIDNTNTGSGYSSSASVSVSSESSDLIQDIVGTLTDKGLNVDSGQTEQWNQAYGGDAKDAGSSTENGEGSVNMSWSLGESKEWSIIGFNINHS